MKTILARKVSVFDIEVCHYVMSINQVDILLEKERQVGYGNISKLFISSRRIFKYSMIVTDVILYRWMAVIAK